MVCKEKNIFKVTQRNLNIIFYFDKSNFDIEKVDKLVKKYQNNIKFSPGAEPYITLKTNCSLDKDILNRVKEFLESL